MGTLENREKNLTDICANARHTTLVLKDGISHT